METPDLDNYTPERLRVTKTVVLRQIIREAREHLWHINQQLWSRNSPITNCLDTTLATLYEELVDVLSISAANTPTASCLFSKCTALAPQWVKLPIVWSDKITLLQLCRTSLMAQLSRSTASTICLVTAMGGMDALRAALSEIRIAEMEQEIAQSRNETMTLQHLATRFFTNASHELRTPLTTILGNTELLLEGTYGDISQEQQAALNHIENASLNLIEIVNNLLDVMHIRSGKLHLQPKLIDLFPVVTGITAILTPLATRRKIRFLHTFDETLGKIETDENILRHILYFLMASSIRATPQQGELTLTAARTDQSIHITIADKAFQLPPEVIDNYRDPIPILESLSARGYEGWEVGLPLMHRFTMLLGGDFRIISLKNEGTRFCVEIPLKHSEKAMSAGNLPDQSEQRY